MARRTLSIIPYYGGKQRMARFIADMLNYDDSDIYIEPFGGACRVLLNKPRHEYEIYNDYGVGVTALMKVMSDPEDARELIYRLYETEYSQEQFDKAKEIYDNAELDLLDDTGGRLVKELKKLLVDYRFIKKNISHKDFMTVLRNVSHIKDLGNKIKGETSQKRKAIWAEIKRLSTTYNTIRDAVEEQGYVMRGRDLDQSINPVDMDMELAIATYIVFKQSRDAMGQSWSRGRMSTDQYRNQIPRLFECAERMEGVSVLNIDAMAFFKKYALEKNTNEIDNSNPSYMTILEWINNPRVMMYCDPSYIRIEDEEELLKDIDLAKEDNISQKIRELHGDKMPRNLGKLYAMSFSYADQEDFIKGIYDAKCKVMISNYDLKLYNKYLTPENGWRRIEVESSTSVGSKVDNRRIEVLWYNY
ncbi:MAG: hypothetical protein GX974_04480 [Clostridiales bacterium]|nr:hypothetical protein [Clostridiales bacterium]